MNIYDIDRETAFLLSDIMIERHISTATGKP